MTQPYYRLPSWKNNLLGARVLLRIDANTSITKDSIANDFRLTSVLPTIDLLKSYGASVTIIAHLGRPQGINKELSLKPIKEWFVQHGYPTELIETPESLPKKPTRGTVYLLENIRFFPEEYEQDIPFAKRLAVHGDYYVNDAFGSLHRPHTSLTTLANLFPSERKSSGPLIEREIAELGPLIKKTQHPFMCLVGGGKIITKLPYIEQFIASTHQSRHAHVDMLAVLPALSFTILKAQGLSMGNSLVDDSLINSLKNIRERAQKAGVELLLPRDILVARGSWEGPLENYSVQNIPDDAVGISCGQESITHLSEKIKEMKTIFLNAGMGDIKRPETLEPLRKIMQAIANNRDAYRVIGGGESITYLKKFGLMEKIDFCSTGGGATLAFICGETLPGLVALE